MKKLGLIKRIGLTATTLFVCLAMLITCFTFVAPRAAKADEATLVNPTTSGEVEVAKGVKVKDTCKYGDEFAVPTGATVTAPNGDEVKVEGGKVTATQLGVYKVSYAKDGISYDFKVSVSLKEDYFLYIADNGADIPTYVQKGDKFTLPQAYVMFYDKNNILTEYPDKDYTVEIADSKNKTYNGEDKTFTAEEDGKVFITYTAILGKTNGTKRLTKTFTVNVQSKVNKSGNPSLAVSGLTQTASVNRPVTLPVAKVSDKNDDNVKVVIEVLDPDNKPVNNVKVNDDGYAYEVKEGDAVKFDNDKTMTFYPTKTGDYKVRYTAYNDFYDANNPSAGGKSGTNEGTIKVADHVAPVFKNTDKYEYLIPEQWGMTVTNAAGDTLKDTQGKIKFLIPELVDNKCHVPANADDKDDLISLYFRITDSDNSKTILTITNILSTGDDGKFTKNDVYKADATFNNEEKAFTFDFAQYNKVNSKNEKAALAGTYTVLFRARDKDNNTSSKTYTITLSETYEDKNVPNTAEVTAPDYLSVADETFTVPYPVYADKEDTRLKVDYRLYSDGKYIEVKGGETASLTAKAGYVVVNEGKEDENELKLGDSIYYYVGVTDKAGNFRSNAIADDKTYIDLSVAENADKYTKIAAVTTIIPETAESEAIGFAGNVKFVNADAKAGEEETTPISVGDTVNAGSFVITAANAKMRNYTGFEVAVYDPEGNHVDVTLETLSDVKKGEGEGAADVAKIYVQNIKFTASMATKAAEGDDPATAYTMTIRVFDVNGNNDVYGYTFTGVNPSTNGNNQTSAIANVDTKGDVNVTYKLKNSVIKHISEKGDFRVVRKITGGVFSLMGNEFTAKTAQSYRVWDGYINANKITATGFDYADVTQVDIPYRVQVVDDAKPVLELQGTMPSYKAKYDESKGDYSLENGLVQVPTAVAYTQYGMGEVTITVTDPNGSKIELNENNQFKAEKDGAYTVTYTATYKNGKEETQPFTINVGDVFAPKFTVTGGTSTASAKKEGDTFTFKTIELTEGGDDDAQSVQITKQIYDPSHELISGSTVDGSYNGYKDKGNNGSEIKLNKVGEYTIVYTAKDSVGNEYKITETLTVTSKGSSTPTTWTTLSTVLIVVAIVLLAGVIIYVVRFRKVKK
ncbi:MAG: hypothetical protein K2F90_04725 [Clostridiales bacterium]|nr:hypothetical protein [Clostridiales bacterium]